MSIIDALNIEYTKVDGNEFVSKMNLTQFHSQIFGILHGGATIAFAETVAGLASNEISSPNLVAVGQTVTASHVNKKSLEGYVLAKGKLISKGKRAHVWTIDVVDETENIISHITVTNIMIDR